MKDFNKVYNQNKKILGIKSAEYKYGEYNWCIRAGVKKYKNHADEDLWFLIYLHCKSDDQNKLPLLANMKFLILNKDKDTRKDLFECNSYPII